MFLCIRCDIEIQSLIELQLSSRSSKYFRIGNWILKYIDSLRKYCSITKMSSFLSSLSNVTMSVFKPLLEGVENCSFLNLNCCENSARCLLKWLNRHWLIRTVLKQQRISFVPKIRFGYQALLYIFIYRKIGNESQLSASDSFWAFFRIVLHWKTTRRYDRCWF